MPHHETPDCINADGGEPVTEEAAARTGSAPHSPSLAASGDASGTTLPSPTNGTTPVLASELAPPLDPWYGDPPIALPDKVDPSTIAVALRNVHKTYLLGLEGVPALRGVTATILRGEFIVILGKSGGGKTSLLNAIGTIDRPTRGDLTGVFCY